MLVSIALSDDDLAAPARSKSNFASRPWIAGQKFALHKIVSAMDGNASRPFADFPKDCAGREVTIATSVSSRRIRFTSDSVAGSSHRQR
jgi:hypothetical protein